MDNKIETLEGAFVGQFTDPLFYKRIVQFSEQLNKASKHSDVIILMARKAVCLYSMLDRLGLVKPECYVTSSRVLDFNPSWLQGKNVILVDDLIIKGTTLLTVTNQLYELHKVESVEVHVLAVNEDTAEQRSKFKLDRGTCLFDDHINYARISLNNQHCSLLSSQIVRSFIASAHPYISDFAISEPFKVGKSNRGAFVNMPRWSYIDTTVENINNNIFTISYLPNKEVRSKLEKNIGIDLNDDFLLKVRLHCRNQGNEIICTAVPIFLFPPMYADDINNYFECLYSKIDEPCDIFVHGVTSVKAKFLILQYVCSVLLLRIFEKEINENFSSNQGLTIRRNIDDTALLFPPNILQVVDYIAENVAIPLKGCLKYEKVDPLPSSSIKMDFSNCESKLDKVKAKFLLQKPFEELYEQYEMKLASEVHNEKESILNLFKQEKTRSLLNRLNKGISFPALKNLLVTQNADDELLFHKNVDRMIDCGMAVPITGAQSENDGRKYKELVYYRALRHGEEVVIGPRERLLICTYIYLISNDRDKWSYGKVEFQKLLVILFRASIKSSFLNLSDVADDEDKTRFHLSYYLYGAVISNLTELKSSENNYSEKESILDKYLPDKYGSSITEYLAEMTKGFVELTNNRVRINKFKFPKIYREEHKFSLDVEERVKSLARKNHELTQFAYFVISLYRAEFRKDDFVVLSSLLMPHQRALAISAELKKVCTSLSLFKATRKGLKDISNNLPNILLEKTEAVFIEGNKKVTKVFSKNNNYIKNVIDRAKHAIAASSKMGFASDSDVDRFFNLLKDDDSSLLSTRYERNEDTRLFVKDYTRKFAELFLELMFVIYKMAKSIALYNGQFYLIDEIDFRINKCLKTSSLISEEFNLYLRNRNFFNKVRLNDTALKLELSASFASLKREYWSLTNKSSYEIQDFVINLHELSTTTKYDTFPNNLRIAIKVNESVDDLDGITKKLQSIIRKELKLEKGNDYSKAPLRFEDLRPDQDFYRVSELAYDSITREYCIVVHGVGQLSHRKLVSLSKELLIKWSLESMIQIELFTSMSSHLQPKLKNNKLVSKSFFSAVSDLRSDYLFSRFNDFSYFAEVRQTDYPSSTLMTKKLGKSVTRLKSRCQSNRDESPGNAQLFYYLDFYTNKGVPPILVDILIITLSESDFQGVRRNISNFSLIEHELSSSFKSGLGYIDTTRGKILIGLVLPIHDAKIEPFNIIRSIYEHFDCRLSAVISCSSFLTGARLKSGDVVAPKKVIPFIGNEEVHSSSNRLNFNTLLDPIFELDLGISTNLLSSNTFSFNVVNIPVLSSTDFIAQPEALHVSKSFDSANVVTLVDRSSFQFFETIHAIKLLGINNNIVLSGLVDLSCSDDEEYKQSASNAFLTIYQVVESDIWFNFID